VPTITKMSVELRHRRQHLSAELGDISVGGMFLHVNERWETGAIVDFEFRLLEDIRPYIGRAEVTRVANLGQTNRRRFGMALRFLEIRTKPLGPLGAVRQVMRSQAIKFEQMVDVLRYAWGEVHGNDIEREFGQPGVGFRQPVLLVQGWLGTRGVLRFMEMRLKRAGHPVFSVDLGALNVRDITESSERITKKVADLSARLGFKRITTMAHSMGGLIALWGIKKLDLARYVNRLVMIGTPCHGTRMTYAGLVMFPAFYKALTQMRPGSSFLQQLHEVPMPGDVDVYCFAARHDLFVTPQEATLEGANNILIEGGHASLITSKYAMSKILSVLEGRDPFTKAKLSDGEVFN